MRWRPIYVRLHLHGTAPSIEGVLVQQPNHFYKLENARVIAAAGESYTADGVTWVPVANVLFWQEVEAK